MLPHLFDHLTAVASSAGNCCIFEISVWQVAPFYSCTKPAQMLSI